MSTDLNCIALPLAVAKGSTSALWMVMFMMLVIEGGRLFFKNLNEWFGSDFPMVQSVFIGISREKSVISNIWDKLHLHDFLVYYLFAIGIPEVISGVLVILEELTPSLGIIPIHLYLSFLDSVFYEETILFTRIAELLQF